MIKGYTWNYNKTTVVISTTVQLKATLITSVLQTISFIMHTLGEMTRQQGSQEQIIKRGLLSLDIIQDYIFK